MANIKKICADLFSYTVIRRDKRKTASLQVSPSNEVFIIVPKDLPPEKVEAVIRRKTPWILAKLKFNREVKYPHKQKEFVSGEAFQYLGRNYRLKVVRGTCERLEMKDGRFIVSIPCGTEEPEKIIRNLLVKWYVRRAEIKLRERSRRHKEEIGVSYTGIRIKTLRQRWGSCAKDGSLVFNWKIILAPISIVDYVVVHELCHLIHHDHSHEFWRLMARMMPDYHERKEWLRVNGALMEV